MQEKKKRHIARYFAIMAAALVLFTAGWEGLRLYQSNLAVASVITLDVNPSIEIHVNKKEKVLDVVALNKDAEIVLEDMDFSGSGIDVTVNALIGSMLRHGYLGEAADSILVTVDNTDATAAKKLEKELLLEVNKVLEEAKVSGEVIGQTVDADKEAAKIAEQYGITEGKAKLIVGIMKDHPSYKVEDLVSKTITELNAISKKSGTTAKTETKKDTTKPAQAPKATEAPKQTEAPKSTEAAQTGDIGRAAAKQAALSHAGVSNIWDYECEVDYERGKKVYDISFKSGSYEYDYDIDAATGAVLKHKKEID